MGIQKEAELYAPIKAYFEQQGYIVKSEVRHCDLVAVRGQQPSDQTNAPIIVEFKKSFNLSLVLQGIARQKITPNVYVAVEYKPRKKAAPQGKWSELTNLCRRLGFGLLTVQFFKRKPAHVELWCKPQELSKQDVARRPRSSVKTKRLLHEFHERSGDYNIGGSSQTEIVTAYRELSLKCAHELSCSGPTKLRHLTERIGSRKISALMQNNVYGWFIRVERGIYDLSPKGKEALIQYEHVIRDKAIEITDRKKQHTSMPRD